MRTATLVLAVLLLTAPGAAVVQNGTSPSDNVSDGEFGITSTPDTGRTDQSFGDEDGPTYRLTFTTTNTTGELVREHVEDIYLGARAVELTGYVQVPTPCHELSTSAEESGNVLTLTVNAESDADACAQQVVTKQYRMDLHADEPFKLELMHGDERVRTLETTDFPPREEKSGFLAFLRDLFGSLF